MLVVPGNKGMAGRSWILGVAVPVAYVVLSGGP